MESMKFFYDTDDESKMSVTKDAIPLTEDAIEQLKNSIDLILEAFNKPILDYDKDFKNG